MDEIIEIMEEIDPDNDYRTCDTLIDDGILDSFYILTLISVLEDTYDIRISPAEIRPENFNSAAALYEMVQRLQD